MNAHGQNSKTVFNMKQFDNFEKSFGDEGLQPTMLGRKPVSGKIISLDSDVMRVRYGHINGDLLLTGQAPENYITIGTLLYGDGIRTCSMEVLQGDIVIFPANFEHETKYRGLTEYLIVSCRADIFLQVADAEDVYLNENDSKYGNVYRLPPIKAKLLRGNAERIGRELVHSPSILEHPNAINELTSDLVRLFVKALNYTDIGKNKLETNFNQYIGIAGKAESWARTRLAKPFPIDDLSRELNISNRQLYRSFQSELGISPARYLKLYRMSRIKCELERACVEDSTVTQIVYKWGFWDLGRFAQTYKQMFGELPSETLNK